MQRPLIDFNQRATCQSHWEFIRRLHRDRRHHSNRPTSRPNIVRRQRGTIIERLQLLHRLQEWLITELRC